MCTDASTMCTNASTMCTNQCRMCTDCRTMCTEASGRRRHVRTLAIGSALLDAQRQGPGPIRYDMVEEPIPGGDGTEPFIKARDGRVVQPFVVVVLPMLEPSRRIPLRAAVDVVLSPYRVDALGSSRTT